MTLGFWFTGDQDDNSITNIMLFCNNFLLLPELLMHTEQKQKYDELISLIGLRQQEADSPC